MIGTVGAAAYQLARDLTIDLIRIIFIESMVSILSRVVASQDQISSDLAGRQVLLNIKSGVYYGLDPVGTRIWSLLQQPRKVSEIRDALLAQYDVSPERLEHDLIALLGKLVDAGLVECSDESLV